MQFPSCVNHVSRVQASEYLHQGRKFSQAVWGKVGGHLTDREAEPVILLRSPPPQPHGPQTADRQRSQTNSNTHSSRCRSGYPPMLGSVLTVPMAIFTVCWEVGVGLAFFPRD